MTGRAEVADTILGLTGGDPFASVLRAAEEHRGEHGPECGLYPAGPMVMRLVATIARIAGARRILDLGCGIGYSTLWLAAALDGDEDGEVIGIDQFPQHIALARDHARASGLDSRCRFLCGRAEDVVPPLAGPFDLAHDDAWFARRPPHLEAVVARLRPGGVLTMPNWFLLEDAVTGRPRRDWAEFAGATWAADTVDYARHLAGRRDLDMTWVVSPPLGVGIVRSERGR